MTVSRSKPNVVIVISDEQNWDTLRCHGNPAVVMPHLDELVEDGGAAADRTGAPLTTHASSERRRSRA
jgi:arylsulfatase A-like enzyme